MAKKFTITATIAFDIEAEDAQEAAALAYREIEDAAIPENIQVWDKEGTNHWFADRYTYTDPPVFMPPNPQGPKTIVPTVWTEETVAAAVGAKVTP